MKVRISGICSGLLLGPTPLDYLLECRDSTQQTDPHMTDAYPRQRTVCSEYYKCHHTNDLNPFLEWGCKAKSDSRKLLCLFSSPFGHWALHRSIFVPVLRLRMRLWLSASWRLIARASGTSDQDGKLSSQFKAHRPKHRVHHKLCTLTSVFSYTCTWTSTPTTDSRATIVASFDDQCHHRLSPLLKG